MQPTIESMIAFAMQNGFKIGFDPSPLIEGRFDLAVCKRGQCAVVALEDKEGYNIALEIKNLISELEKHFETVNAGAVNG